MKNKRAIFAFQTPIFIFMMYLGVTGLIKGVETHDMLRIVLKSIGVAIFIAIYTLLFFKTMRKAS
jgi:hypothetical protein